MKVLFRADASSAIGIGHVARCLTLAEVLAAQGAQVSFACRELPGHQMARIAEAGYAVFALDPELPDEVAVLAAGLPAQALFDWLIVDHYQLGADWEGAVRKWARRIMVIDDLGDRQHDCDLLLDQNFSASLALYQPLVPAHCRILAGPRHALLRPVFRQLQTDWPGGHHRVLVSFGGFDQAGMTLKTLQALDGMADVQVQCIAGHSSPDLAALQALVAGNHGWELLPFVSDLPERMAAATVFVGAGGGTTWERAALGLPSVCVAVAANQFANAEALARAGMHLYLGPAPQVMVDGLSQAIGVLLANPFLRQHFAERSMALVDGLGAQRVAVALQADSLSTRLATEDDAQLLFDGRNAEAVRRWSVEQAPLDFDRHRQWLSATLANEQRLLLIGEAADGPVGMLRYDLLEPGRARVSLYLFEGRFGLGWGRALLAAGERAVRARWAGLRVIDAQVIAQNQASLAMFRAAGYTQAECHFERELKDSQHEQF